jgi:hypothetical protein
MNAATGLLYLFAALIAKYPIGPIVWENTMLLDLTASLMIEIFIDGMRKSPTLKSFVKGIFISLMLGSSYVPQSGAMTVIS